jgi:MFS family permease
VASTVGTVAARLTAGRIYDRKGHIFVVPPAALLIVGSILAIIAVPPAPLLYAAAVLYGLGAGALFPSIQTLALESVPPERRTVASAYFFVSFDCGIGLGTVFLGFVAGFFHTYDSVFWASGALFVILVLAYFAAYRKAGFAAAPEG